MNSDKEKMIQLNAFRLFTMEGMEKVEKRYPDQVAFVEANKEKTLSQLQSELLTHSEMYMQ